MSDPRTRFGVTGRPVVGGMPLSSDNPGWSPRERRVILTLLPLALLMPILLIVVLNWWR